MQYDRLLINLRLASLVKGEKPYGLTDDTAIAIKDGRIAWIGSTEEAPENADEIDNLDGRLVTPALVDCHTHLIFAGDRSDEYERRLAGESYASIAQSGGGIRKTVEATRASDAPDLASAAITRLTSFAEEGVGTVEIKSGYGLTHKDELKMLKAARACGLATGMRITTTLLAAHTIPVEYEGRSGDYIDEVCIPLVQEAAREGLADAVDAFCENIAFSADETRRVFEAAKEVGLPVKLHADQLTDSGGAKLVADFEGLSADHIEYTSQAGIDAMAKAGTIGVLLPGAFYAIGETQKPPIAALRKAGVAMAVSTDANPGSSPMLSLLTAANMACALFGLTVEEAFAGITREGAAALGLQDEIGTIEIGKNADLAIWDVTNPAEIIQWIGRRPLHGRILQGEWA